MTAPPLVASHGACACVPSCFSRVRLFMTPWTVAHQAPLSMEFSREVYWSGLLCPPPGVLSDLGTKPTSLTSPALTDNFFTCHSWYEKQVVILHGILKQAYTLWYTNGIMIGIYLWGSLEFYVQHSDHSCCVATKHIKTWPIQTESCCEYKAHTGLWRYCMKKKKWRE